MLTAPASAALTVPPAPPRRASAPLRSWRRAAALARGSLLFGGLLRLSICILAPLWLLIAFQVHREHDEAVHAAEQNLSNLTRAFAEHSAKTIEGADQALRFVRSEYLRAGAPLDIAGYLRRETIIHKAYHLISVIGPDGYVSHSSQPFQRIDLRDREHFRVHVDAPDDKLFISRPVLGRVSGKWSIQLTRRVTLPDGRFGGVVVLSLAPDYLTSFYKDVDLGPSGVITLVGFDGVVRARATPASTAGGQDVSDSALFRAAQARGEGAIRMPAKIDGVDRIWAFRRLDEPGLFVFTGMAASDVFAASDRRRTVYLLGGLAVTVLVVALLGGLLARMRRQAGLVRMLRESRAKANEANQLKTRFLASVSHELRTPLNGILGYAELIRDTSADGEAREYGQVIHQSAKHLHKLVDMILDLAKIESHRMPIVNTPVALRGLLDEALRQNQAAAAGKGLDTTLTIAETLPTELLTDRQRVLQILDNLLDNAVKFTARGSIGLTARPDRGGVCLEVTDTGVGIAPAQLSSLFTRFQAITAEFVHPEQGAGLGLPLSRELAELLGGSLAIDSSPRGTRATLWLPLQNPPTTKATS
jgi:two-component system sensor histidine kinase BarA